MWKCTNEIRNDKDTILFKSGNTYEEGDDRGDTENPDGIAICLFDETGNRTYLFDKQVTNNFVEVNKKHINVSTDDFIELLKIVSGISSTAKKTDNQKSMYDIKSDEISQEKISALISKYRTK